MCNAYVHISVGLHLAMCFRDLGPGIDLRKDESSAVVAMMSRRETLYLMNVALQPTVVQRLEHISLESNH